MEEIRWIHSIDCRSCVLEMRDASRRKMEQIVDERKHTPKCRGCERLANVTEEMEKYGDTGQWNKKRIRNRSC